ncbi:MAG: RecX family transcriptional regulator [Pseudoflavonifractor sp.]|nr:RecX family transcriptional regulator [Pseudoflavonifractor sp.]
MRISKLEPSQRVKGRWLVWLDDGSLLRVSENEVVSFALYAGMELTDDSFDSLTAAAGVSAVRSKALDLISARPLSRRELIQKLTAQPRDREKQPLATPEQAEEAADWLERLGYLNDAEYAKTVARHYSAKGYGDRKVRDELFRRGVPRALWEAALEEAQSPEDGVDTFLHSRLKGSTPDARELKRVSDALARRGYRWDEIKEGLRRYGAEIEEE